MKNKNNYINEYEFERHKQFLLLQYALAIPWSIPLAEYEYRCIEAGPTGKYPCLFYIKGETYWIRKSRHHHDYVEMWGKIYNYATDLATDYKHHFSVPLENCKKIFAAHIKSCVY